MGIAASSLMLRARVGLDVSMLSERQGADALVSWAQTEHGDHTGHP